MAQRLNGKVAVVTGGGDGLGRGIALGLAEEGVKVVVADFGKDAEGKYSADKVVSEIKQARGQAAANYDSVATMAGGENIIKTATSNFGRLDILVCCAGNFKAVKTVDITEPDWDSILNVHLKGHFACCRAAIPEMLKQKGGRIITFSSRAAAFGTGSIAYAAAKAGILGITSMLAQEQKENGITVNSILPSASTKLFPRKNQAAGPKMADNMPYATSMDPNDVAPMVVYLCTDDAKNITDRYIYVAGGDICFYSHPLQLGAATPVLLRKPGKWTIDELSQIIPSVIA
jgi:NAD(P)-dependent dehydrogenase (short-subunit alcohol dehydrogenase family)